MYQSVHNAGWTMPSWIEHAIFWHLYPLGFTGAPIRPQIAPPLEHRLEQLTGWLKGG